MCVIQFVCIDSMTVHFAYVHSVHFLLLDTHSDFQLFRDLQSSEEMIVKTDFVNHITKVNNFMSLMFVLQSFVLDFP